MILPKSAEFEMNDHTYELAAIYSRNSPVILDPSPSISVDIYNNPSRKRGVWTSATCDW